MTKLKQLRSTNKLSQSELANKAEVNVRVLQHYEQGSKILDHAKLHTILKICKALNCRLEDVIENEETLKLLKETNKLPK